LLTTKGIGNITTTTTTSITTTTTTKRFAPIRHYFSRNAPVEAAIAPHKSSLQVEKPQKAKGPRQISALAVAAAKVLVTPPCLCKICFAANNKAYFRSGNTLLYCRQPGLRLKKVFE
jgi:hypothetical protein